MGLGKAIAGFLLLMLTISFFSAILMGGWACGLRLHPEVLPRYFKEDAFQPYYRISFKTKQLMIAKIIADNADTLKVQVRKSIFELSKSDLREYRKMTPEELKADEYQEWLSDEPEDQIITYSPEDNLLVRYGWWPKGGKPTLEYLKTKAMAELEKFQSSRAAVHIKAPRG